MTAPNLPERMDPMPWVMSTTLAWAACRELIDVALLAGFAGAPIVLGGAVWSGPGSVRFVSGRVRRSATQCHGGDADVGVGLLFEAAAGALAAVHGVDVGVVREAFAGEVPALGLRVPDGDPWPPWQPLGAWVARRSLLRFELVHQRLPDHRVLITGRRLPGGLAADGRRFLLSEMVPPGNVGRLLDGALRRRAS